MEQLLRETLLASGTSLLGIFLLPLALVRGPAEVAEPPQTPAADTALEQTEEAESPAAPHDRERTLRVLEGDTVREMTMEDYLFGVTAAEMPALTRSPATLLAPCLVRVNARAFFTPSSRIRAASSLVLLPRST